MPIRSSYSAGMPCWIDCITPDPVVSQGFYGALFGWTFEDEDGYSIVRCRGEVVGGLGVAPPGRGSFWTTYLASKDLDATAALVRMHGGRVVMPPVVAGRNGRLFLAMDPAGAAVGFWQGATTDGIVLTSEPGAMTWHELRTPSAAVLTFYTRLFTLTAEPRADDVLVSLDGTEAFGVREVSAMPFWLPYFGATADVVPRALELGAGVLDDALADGATLLRDPLGAVFAVMVT